MLPATSMLPPGLPRASIALHPTDRARRSSSRRNCRCRLWSSTRTASSMPPPPPTARFIDWQRSQPKRKRRLKATHDDFLERDSSISIRAPSTSGTRSRQRRHISMSRPAITEKSSKSAAEWTALALFQERRSAHSRARARSQGKSDCRLRRQRPRLSHRAERRSIRSLQRSEEGNYRARHRQCRQHLRCWSRGEAPWSCDTTGRAHDAAAPLPLAPPPGGTAILLSLQPRSATSFPAPGAGRSGGSEIYRIAPDGAPSRLWSSHEDLVYALGFDQHGRLIAGTGNRGHIFAINGGRRFHRPDQGERHSDHRVRRRARRRALRFQQQPGKDFCARSRL